MVSRNGKPSLEDFKVPTRSQEIQQSMHALESRDMRLFSISLLMLLVFASGVLALIYPTLRSNAQGFLSESRMLPHLCFGLFVLISLLNGYIIFERRQLNTTRRRLVEELIFNERMEAVSLTDATTQLFNRRAMEQMLPREAARTNRMDSTLCLVVLDIIDFEQLSNRLGTQETDQFLYEAAQLVRNTFRGSDMVFRHAETKFLVVMPDTAEQRADFAIKRLLSAIERHNAELRCHMDLAFGYGVAQHVDGSRITDTLLTAERKAFLHRHDLVPVF
jgi:diguanylate cyclase (GGDEF)-like protein